LDSVLIVAFWPSAGVVETDSEGESAGACEEDSCFGLSAEFTSSDEDPPHAAVKPIATTAAAAAMRRILRAVRTIILKPTPDLFISRHRHVTLRQGLSAER